VNELMRRAVALLARREHSRAELARKLAAHGSEEEIEHILSSLERQGLLSDARFADAYVRSHAERFGAARLRRALQAKGVNGETIAASVEPLADELDRARGVWTKKFGNLPGDAREWAKQARFLQGRGFSPDVIRKLLKDRGE
jgi:regulatory protein